jgi:predicted metal-dependent hydrolase
VPVVNPFNWISTLGNRRATEYVILVSGIPITVTRKRIRSIRLKVHPPDGRVSISSPKRASRRLVEEFAASQLDWIRRHQDRLRLQPREIPRRFESGEFHALWGQPYLLTVVEGPGRQGVDVAGNRLTLSVRPGSDTIARAAIVTAWHKTLLHEALPPLIRNWEQKLNVQLNGYYLRRMTTRWGTCNHRTKHIRLNTELVTRPGHLLDYVVAHEMVHLIVPNHGKRFIALMDEHYSSWRAARAELNGLAQGPDNAA